ncbi:MAG: DivIVA domain-containing protein, partial [Candidatus Krumholzibacteria bacterium]|nr:DivIVA domain-containing protein [Candidatus Krumholzibacteria bacterium]
MRITPLDIRKQEFKKTMRGLDSDEVYAFLNTVAEEYETVLSDNKRLRERIVELEERLKEFKSMETNLRNTLLTAERLTVEAKENARKEAGLIVREAEVEAEKAAEAIRAHTQQLRREILELKKNKDNYITRMRTLLDNHQSVISGFEDDFAEVDHEIDMIGQKVEEDMKGAIPGPRMTRDRITEDFAHEEKEEKEKKLEETDKVTWDDERRREDIPRPSMPAPPHEADSSPEKKNAAPREEAAGTMNVPTAQQIEMETVAASGDEFPMADTEETRVDLASVNAGKIEVADEDNPGNDGHFNENAVRRNVARSIEDSMYPEAHIHEKQSNTAPAGPAMESQSQAQPSMQQPPAMTQDVSGQAPAPQHEVSATGTAVQDLPPAPDMTQSSQQQPVQPMPKNIPEQDAQNQDQPDIADRKKSDDWKSYEVNKAKPDWSNYEINGSEKPQQSSQQQPVSEPQQSMPTVHQNSDPSDVEVEAALSGLEEMGGLEQQVQQPTPTQDEQASEQSAPEKSSQPPAETQVEAETQVKTETDKDDSTSTWSMEELRKNLTNMD